MIKINLSSYIPDSMDYSSSSIEGNTGFTNGRNSATDSGVLHLLSTKHKPLREVCEVRRNSEIIERLARLRTELGKISPFPETARQAHAAILAAMARADLGDWTIPDLDDTSSVSYRDGSIRINLIAHAITFNPWGAFRISNLRSSVDTYFELAGTNQRIFTVPSESDE